MSGLEKCTAYPLFAAAIAETVKMDRWARAR